MVPIGPVSVHVTALLGGVASLILYIIYTHCCYYKSIPRSLTFPLRLYLPWSSRCSSFRHRRKAACARQISILLKGHGEAGRMAELVKKLTSPHGSCGRQLPLSMLLLFLLFTLGHATPTPHFRIGGLPRQLLQGKQPYPCSVDGTPDGPMYMTAINKCPKDEFYVGFGDNGADATPIKAGEQYSWKGAFFNGIGPDSNAYGVPLIVLRATDGKIIAPKGARPNGTFYDISSTKQKICQLFLEGSNPLRFASFRANMDAERVYWDDFASPTRQKTMPKDGIPCEQYRDDGSVDGWDVGRIKVGKVVDMYTPDSCLYGIDDCTT